jgi:hypothetical protein
MPDRMLLTWAILVGPWMPSLAVAWPGTERTCVKEDTATVERIGRSRWHVVSAHYDLHLEVPDEGRAKEIARMAEAAWASLSGSFGASPPLGDGERLRIGWFANKSAWEIAITKDGDVPPPSTGGYYSPRSKRAYLWTQPTIWYTNSVFLHELFHQFHYLTRTDNTPRPDWYVEGLAEHVSRHGWDGECLWLAQAPQLTQEDLPAQALAAFENGVDLAAVTRGVPASRAVYWALWHHLDATMPPDALASMMGALDRGVAGTWAPTDGFDALVRQTVLASQEPLAPLYAQWAHVRPGIVRSVAKAFTAAEVKGGATRLEVEALPQDRGAGVLVAHGGPDDLEAWLVDRDGKVTVFAVRRGVPSWRAVGRVDAAESYAIVWEPAARKLSIGTATFEPEIAPPEAAGLASYGPAWFERLKWTPPP